MRGAVEHAQEEVAGRGWVRRILREAVADILIFGRGVIKSKIEAQGIWRL